MTMALVPTAHDVRWLQRSYPALEYCPRKQRVIGELDFRARYDRETRRLHMDDLVSTDRVRDAGRWIHDVFEIEVRLDSESTLGSRWPKVFEVGGRISTIASRLGIPVMDLHCYKDGSLCLGLRLSPGRQQSLRSFVTHLVIPFLYRVAYIDRFGSEAARRDLWGEYSHGGQGINECEAEVAQLLRVECGRNDKCPCGSGAKFKKCCLDEVREYRARLHDGRRVMSGMQ